MARQPTVHPSVLPPSFRDEARELDKTSKRKVKSIHTQSVHERMEQMNAATGMEQLMSNWMTAWNTNPLEGHIQSSVIL